MKVSKIKWGSLHFLTNESGIFGGGQLQHFAYKIELSWWIFILAGIIALIIVMITVSWQTFKVARRNPVEALRYE